ncbi:ribonuclease BN, partial [Streptomyces sp. MCAF7]
MRGKALEELRRALAASGTTRKPSGAVGLLVALVSATAFSRALQTVCERCWDLPRARMRVAAWRWLLWVLVWLAVLFVQAPVRRGFGFGIVSGLVLSLLSSVLLWWWTQHLLLGGRVGWLPLLPGAVLAGTGSVALGYASRLV